MHRCIDGWMLVLVLVPEEEGGLFGIWGKKKEGKEEKGENGSFVSSSLPV